MKEKRLRIVSVILAVVLTLSQGLMVSAGELKENQEVVEDTVTIQNDNQENKTETAEIDSVEEDGSEEIKEELKEEIRDNRALDEDEMQEADDEETETESDPEEEEDVVLEGSWVLSGRWWYRYSDGSYLSDGIYEIDGVDYAFDKAGWMVTGWYQNSTGWYYFSGNGAKYTGWIQLGGIWYYLKNGQEDPEYPGRMAANCEQKIRNVRYRFTSSGAMVTGWALIDNNWYYYLPSGAKAEGGWQYVKNVWYYMDPENEGKMIADCEKEIGGKTYKFASSGAMITGWVKQGNDWYYYMPAGDKATGGWIQAGGVWYYMNPADGGKMVSSGWREIGNVYYYFHASGAMATGWIYTGGEWYYLHASGAMATGWISLGENWYYLYTKNDSHGGTYGAMAKNTTIDGYVIAPNGAYNYAYQKFYNLLNQIGWNLRAAFNWSTNLTYSTMVVNPGLGSAWYADYGYQNGKGNCYVMAASFYQMAILLGYDAHQIAGNVLTKTGMTPHSWVEIVIDGTLYVFDPSFAGGNKRNGYQITYGASGTFRYTNYYRMN